MPAGRLDSPFNGKKILLELAINWASLSLHAYVFSRKIQGHWDKKYTSSAFVVDNRELWTFWLSAKKEWVLIKSWMHKWKKREYFNFKTSKISIKSAVANLHPLCSVITINSGFMESMEKEEKCWRLVTLALSMNCACAGCVMELHLYCKSYCARNIGYLPPDHGGGRDAALSPVCVQVIRLLWGEGRVVGVGLQPLARSGHWRCSWLRAWHWWFQGNFSVMATKTEQLCVLYRTGIELKTVVP